MSRLLRHAGVDAHASVGADAPSGSTAGAGAVRPRRERSAGGDLFADVPQVMRLQMELVARAASSPERALPGVIDVLVSGSPQKRAAIVAAITGNDPLREQWERTWEVLRG